MKTFIPLLCLPALTGVLAAAQLPAAWKHEQTVHVNQTGFVRVSLPLDSLANARPNLEDLRWFDDAGREVPFALERPRQSTARYAAPKDFQVTLRPDATLVLIESDTAQPVEGLTLDTPARDFLKAVKLEAAGADGRWQTLRSGEPFFRQSGGAQKLSLEFPAAPWRRFRLTLDDQKTAAIPLTGAQLQLAEPEPAPAEPLEARIVDREETPGQTRLTVQAAGANVALAGVDIDATDALFTRAVTLACRSYAEGEVREEVLARGVIYRVAVDGQTASSNSVFAVDAPLPTRELIITVQNGDSPPLAIRSVKLTRRPVYLAWMASQSGTFHFLSGNPQCPAPVYDLASLHRDVKATLIERPAVSALTPNVSYRAPEAAPDLAEQGSAIDLAGWSYRKRLAPAQAGVQQVELDQEILSRTGGAVYDLRVVKDGRQLPYLLERTALERSVTVTTERSNDPKQPALSRWTLRLPRANLPLTRFTCETDAAFFKRAGALTEQARDERGNRYPRTLASFEWTRAAGERKAAMVITLSAAPTTDQCVLEIENGDNPPLELKNFQAFHGVTRVLFKASPGADLWLYYGNRNVVAPRYDIDLVARQILAAEKIKLAAGNEEALQQTFWGEGGASGPAGWLLWVVLGVVVVGLVVVMTRLLPKPPPA